MKAWNRAGIALITTLSVLWLAAPVPAAEEAPPLADAKALFEKNCGTCHPLEQSLEKKVDRDGWTTTIKRMIANGAPLDEKQGDQIVGYLTAKSLFETKCNVCHDLEKPLAAIKNPEAWRATVLRMAAMKPGKITDAEAGAITLYLSLVRPAK